MRCGEVTPRVVHLQEVAALPAVRRQAAVPRVGHEQRHVAGRAVEDHGRPAVVREIHVVHAVEGREPARAMTTGHDRGWPVGERAVLQQDVRADREHGVRDAVVPLHAFGPRDVRPRVGVPEAARELGRVAPRGVGDHVAVVAEQRLDHLEDLRVRRSRAGTPRCGSASRSGTRPCRRGSARAGPTRTPRRSPVRSSPTSASVKTPRNTAQPSRSSCALASGASPVNTVRFLPKRRIMDRR